MFCPVLKLREEKRTWVRVEGGKVDFFFFFSTGAQGPPVVCRSSGPAVFSASSFLGSTVGSFRQPQLAQHRRRSSHPGGLTFPRQRSVGRSLSTVHLPRPSSLHCTTDRGCSHSGRLVGLGWARSFPANTPGTRLHVTGDRSVPSTGAWKPNKGLGLVQMEERE
jgi:hypothetical protein